jgi:hypothetical protein
MCPHSSACIFRYLVGLVLLGHMICTSSLALSTDTQQYKVSFKLHSTSLFQNNKVPEVRHIFPRKAEFRNNFANYVYFWVKTACCSPVGAH